jgi:hypothetical protein
MADTTLGASLNTDMSLTPYMGSSKEAKAYSEKAAPLLKQQVEGEAELKKEEMLQQGRGFEAKAKAERGYQNIAKDLNKKAENKELAYPRPEFHPTKENAQSLGELFSLVATMGLMLGGSGKMAAQGSLDAMGGMLKGWQSGRKDLYEKELKEFDKEYKRIQDIRTDIQNHLQKGMQLAAIDKDASYAEYQQAAAISGASSIGASYIKAGQPKVFLDLMNKTYTIDKDVKDRQQRAAEAQARLQQQERHHQDTIARQSGKTGDRFGFGAIVATASNEAAASMRNLMGLPMESTSGIFGGRQTNSLFTAPSDAFANTITKESTQRYNAEAGKLSYTLSQLIKGGRVVSVNEVAIMDNILKIKEGDSLETAATRLAEARQIAERAMEVRLKDPNTPVDLKEIYQDNLNSVKLIIPFTVDDVNKFVQERDKSITFSEELKNKYNKSTPTETKITPTQNDRDIAKQSPELRAKFVKHFGVEP